MQISYNWLKALAPGIKAPVRQFAQDITMTGTKVESVIQLGEDLVNIVVGKIIKKEKHANADSLFVCQVDIGDKIAQIVTAATNIYEGAIIPVVLDGGAVSGGRKIKKGKLRGELSHGMMCSIEEMGYTTQEYPEADPEGIYIFPSDNQSALGSDAREALGILDDVVDFEITSNRPDCYSVIGVAREAAATYGIPFAVETPTIDERGQGDAQGMISVRIDSPDLCPRYIARVVTDVKIEPSPLWMRRRLIACGIRPINNIVDITNYVMLEYGQPMHAFDIDNIAGRQIIVRNAAEGEVFTTLDSQSRSLEASMLVIADPEKVVAIAGIMGGENSKVTENASAVLFESANFNGTNIRVSAKKLGLRTDASSKFEKGLDPNLAEAAVNRAMQLVEQLGSGVVIPGMADCYPSCRAPWSVSFDPTRINGLLGMSITIDEICELLARVEIIAKQTDGVWLAQIPTFRPDIECEADLAEEVARLRGYDNIPVSIESGRPTVGQKTWRQQTADKIKWFMMSEGYDETLTYPFESPKYQPGDAVRIVNPLGEEYSVMRAQTLHSVMANLATNFSRRNENARLFELCRIYVPTSPGKLPDEREKLVLGAYGGLDFFDVKGAIQRLCEMLGVSSEYGRITAKDYHPGRAAEIRVNGEAIGLLAEINPTKADEYEITERVYYAELDLESLFQLAKTEIIYKPLPKHPAISRDISMKIDDNVPVGEIEKTIRERAGKYLDSIKLFDLYRGEQVGEGYKSVAYALTFRAADRTLKDNEANDAIKKIIANLESKLGAQLRR
jgi:phenylalanyl-tRNA synthetase beta chain